MIKVVTPEIPEILRKLLEIREIQVFCLNGEKCREGHCEAILSMYPDGTIALVTGISPDIESPLSQQLFSLENIQTTATTLIIRTKTGRLMRLEQQGN